MWHVEDVRDVILIFFECNAMYVEDVEDGKGTYTHTFLLITFLMFNQFSICKKFWDVKT